MILSYSFFSHFYVLARLLYPYPIPFAIHRRDSGGSAAQKWVENNAAAD
jgi:hypothetical protein